MLAKCGRKSTSLNPYHFGSCSISVEERRFVLVRKGVLVEVHEADTCVPLSVSVSKGEGGLKKSGWRGKRKERRRRMRIRGGGGGRNVVTENATRWSKRWRRRTHEEGVRRVLAG